MSAGQGAGVAQRRILSSPMESVQGRTDLSLSDVPSARQMIGRGARPTGRKDEQQRHTETVAFLTSAPRVTTSAVMMSNLSAAPEN